MPSSKNTRRTYDKIPGFAAGVISMAFVIFATILTAALHLHIHSWPVFVVAAIGFVAIWRAVWTKRHPGERMRFQDSPTAGVLPFVAALAVLVAIKAIESALHSTCPPWLEIILIFGAYFGVGITQWRYYR